MALAKKFKNSKLLCCAVRPADMMMVTPINDLQGTDPATLVKGERLMRCKLASVHRLFDLFGWAQISRTCLTVGLLQVLSLLICCV